MKLRLPDSVFSPQDLAALILEVREYSKWAVHENIKKRVNVNHSSEAPVLTAAAKDLIREWNTDKKDLDSLIKTLEEYKTHAPSLTMTLAAPPTNGVKTDLVSWCRKNISPDILINFQFNATLLGGMVIRYGSHVYDWSFRRQILDGRGKFPEVLRRV